MNQPDYQQAAWYVTALTGSVETVMDFRCISDTDKAKPAHNYRGTLAECWETLTRYNANGYGIFTTVNAMDGVGRDLANVHYIRAHVVDLDNTITAQANYERAVADGASFAVQSSPGKYHVYWRMQPYQGNEFYTAMQRKLLQYYDGDKTIIDSSRVLRVPGFYHLKAVPYQVTGWQLPTTHIYTAQEMQDRLAHVTVVDRVLSRHPLGTAELQAPSFDWLKFALSLINPNDLDRGEWLSISAAFKQAGWSHSNDEELYGIWNVWCKLYSGNEEGENRKLWASIRDTETGWATFERRTTVKAYMAFGHAPKPKEQTPPATTHQQAVTTKTEELGELLSPEECAEYFKGCYFINRIGQIFTQEGRLMNATQFNGRYGGKVFIISGQGGKVTDEPWKAALRSTCWTVPKLDHMRFLPDKPSFDVVVDSLGRSGLNTYIPARIDARPGDVTPWLEWFNRILPDANDQRILFEYMAHCVKFPGYKIPWSPMLQSTEGIGKTIFREVMAHALGDMYVYSPKAPELVKSGSTFNAWMRGKLMIVVDEIKIDERRELIEILKPMITDHRVEIQSKGVDQDMEDNPANWLFFSNYKDAIPINKNGRRYAIFYSALQSKADILAAGMDDSYFQAFWAWLRDGGGLQAVAHWLLNYPIERGGVPVRAPETSSYKEALVISRSPMESVIAECVADGMAGFKGGYVSTLAAINRAKAAGIRNPTSRTVQACMEAMGYASLGKAPRAFFQENPDTRSDIYGIRSDMNVMEYGRVQGYE